MVLPNQPVTLDVEQVADLSHKLSTLRHDVNNNLSLIMAAAEMVRYKPDQAARMLATLMEQPPKITENMSKFSAEFERMLGMTRP